MSADASRNVLGGIVRGREVQPVLSRREVPWDEVFSGHDLQMFRWVLDYYTRYGRLPPYEQFHQEFPDIELPWPEEPLEYWIQVLLGAWMRGRAQEEVERLLPLIRTDPHAGIVGLRNSLNRLVVETSPVSDVDMAQDVDERMRRYQEVAKYGVSAYEFPWPALNRSTLGGLRRNDFMLVSARPESGKSWLLCLFAVHFYRQGKKVLFVTNEMSVDTIERRIDAILAQVDYSAFQMAVLGTAELERYRRALEEMRQSSSAPMIVGDAALSPAAIQARMQRPRPDVVLVDGLYLSPPDDTRARMSLWEQVTTVSRAVKRISRIEGIPIVASVQINREGEQRMGKHQDVGLSNLALADALGQDADLVITLSGVEGRADVRSISVTKAREGRHAKFLIRFSPATDFSEEGLATGEDADSGIDY